MRSGIFSGRAINKYPSFLPPNMSSLDLSLAGLKIPQLWLNITMPWYTEAMPWCKGKNFHHSVGMQGSEKRFKLFILEIQKKEQCVITSIDSSDSIYGERGVEKFYWSINSKVWLLVWLGNSVIWLEREIQLWNVNVTLGKRS